MSTDPAHSLADSFEVDLDGGETEVAPRLFATQLDATERMESNWGEIRDYLREIFDWAGLDDVEAEELAVIPGLEEIFALTDICAVDEAGTHDVLVVDCAPTAETIRLLSLPDVMSWYMDRAFPLSRRVARAVGPMVNRLTNLPVASDPVFSAVDRLYRQLDRVRDLLRDSDSASVRLVVTPEKMVVAEARRTFTYLALFGYAVDAVVANRLLPAEIDDPWFAAWKDNQVEMLDVIDAGFAPTPVLRWLPCGGRGPRVWTDWREFAAATYGDTRRHRGTQRGVNPSGSPPAVEGFALHLDVPFVERDDLDLARGRDELFITVGPYRRAVMLPDSLRRREVGGRRGLRRSADRPFRLSVGADAARGRAQWTHDRRPFRRANRPGRRRAPRHCRARADRRSAGIPGRRRGRSRRLRDGVAQRSDRSPASSSPPDRR